MCPVITHGEIELVQAVTQSLVVMLTQIFNVGAGVVPVGDGAGGLGGDVGVAGLGGIAVIAKDMKGLMLSVKMIKVIF